MIFVPAAEFMLSCVIWFVGEKFCFFFSCFFSFLQKKPACFRSCWSLWAYCRSISRSFFFPSLHLIKADRDFILAPSGRPGLYCRWCSSQAIKTIRAQRLFVLITSRLSSLLHNKSSSRKGPRQLALREIITVLWVYYYSGVAERPALRARFSLRETRCDTSFNWLKMRLHTKNNIPAGLQFIIST